MFSVIGVRVCATASVCVTPRAGHLAGHIPQTIRLVCHVVIRFTSLFLIASYPTSAMMSSAMTMTRWPVAKGEHGLTHAREGTSTVHINSNNPTTSHDFVIFMCRTALCAALRAILLWASLYMMDIEGLTTGPFSDIIQTNDGRCVDWSKIDQSVSMGGRGIWERR